MSMFPLFVHHYAASCQYSESDMPRIQEVDEFIADLWKVHLKVKEEGYTQVSGHLPDVIFILSHSSEPLSGTLQIGLHGPPRP